MDGQNHAGDDRTFRIDPAGDGTSRLSDVVKEKLKELMGDYTDDTLVEYILVLLRNGRSKDESQRELNVFLGDDSVSFVSWLWDHLSSNIHLYSQQKVSPPDEVNKTTHILDEHSGQHNSQIRVHDNEQIDSENDREKSKISRHRLNREWKVLAQEEGDAFPLRSTITKILHSEEKSHTRSNVRRSPPRSHVQVHRKRSREEEREPIKRDSASHQVVGAARRLLQFAVRDAVGTVQQSSSRSEPVIKRLRSEVSMSTAVSLLDERPQRIRSVAGVRGPVSAAIKAAAEAAEDVIKARCSGSVFDRLNHGAYAAQPVKQPSNPEESMLEDDKYMHDRVPESNRQEYDQVRDYDGEFDGNMTMFDRDTGTAVDSASDNDGYDNAGIAAHQHLIACQSASTANKDNNSLRVQHSVAQNVGVARGTRLVDQDPPASANTKPSSKIVNISVNVNTWKPPHYKVSRDFTEEDTQMAVVNSEMSAGKTSGHLSKENNASMAGNEHEMTRENVQKESPKNVAATPGSYTTVRPSEDIDSRTVFVSNVHFAATKDALSRHFNKFGEVLKVIIVSDAATGQPKGSAYVEFLRKESAESALSLNGTSFLSRILKVIRKNSMHHEATPMLGWPLMVRAFPFASRLRLPFPRGVLSAGAFRPRLPVKPGARSLQWKRGASTSQTTAEGMKSNQNASRATGNNEPSPTGRNLTYIRLESKVDGSSGPP